MCEFPKAASGNLVLQMANAQHQRPIGRRQIKTDDIADLVDEQRVIGKLDRLRAMRLQAESVPNPPDRRMRKPGLSCHGADSAHGLDTLRDFRGRALSHLRAADHPYTSRA